MTTNNWAIIIGINQYWKPSACLKGAVGDALRVAEWLLGSEECGVPPGNMYLLANPLPSKPPDGVDLRDATADNLIRVMNDLNRRSEGQGDRLFFYYSGHGINNRESFRNEQALVMTDFDPDLTDKARKLGPIVQFFGETAFAEQFFFIDACRSPADFDFDFETGSTTVKNKPDAVKASKVDQYILYSTTPGSKSKELAPAPGSPPGSEQGAFTGVLLEGLAGDGTAKVFDSENGDYVVRAEALMDYVIERVSDLRLTVSKRDPTLPLLIQLPRKGGERSNNNPVLARVPASEVKPESLNLFVEPDSAWPLAEVVIRSEDFNDPPPIKPVPGAPITLSPLRPMKYTVRATAPDHTASKKSFDLYKPVDVTLRLDPGAVTIKTDDPPGEGGGEGASVDGGGGTVVMAQPNVVGTAPFEAQGSAESARGVEESVSAEPEEAKTTAHLIVETSDPLSPLELADSTGHVLRAGQGRLDIGDMSPGYYRVRLLTPEGQTVEDVVDLWPGEVERKELSAPDPPQSRLFSEIVATANFFIQSDKTLDVSKTVGPIASAQLSTILALALTACNHNDSWGERLKTLGLKSFSDATGGDASCGLQLVAGVEGAGVEEASAVLAGARLRLWPFGEFVPESAHAPAALSGAAGVAQYAEAAAPGPHWFSIEMPGQKPVVFALTLLPGRVTVLVAHLDAAGQARVFQYAPESAPGRFSTPMQVRRLEIIERFYLSGLLDHAYNIAGGALGEEAEDPLLICLRGYLALKLNHWDEAGAAASRLTELHETLSDGHVIRGEVMDAKGKGDEATEAYAQALLRGLPVFAEGLTRLHNAVSLRADSMHGLFDGGVKLLRGGVAFTDFEFRKQILDRVFDRHAGGILWTAFSLSDDEPKPFATFF